MTDKKNPGQNIDQIRDLIFGEQIQKYDKQFSEIAKDNKKLNELIEEVSQQLKIELEQKISAVKKDVQKIQSTLQKEIDELQSDKVDRLQMANLLIELGMRLKGENVLDSITSEGEQSNNG